MPAEAAPLDTVDADATVDGVDRAAAEDAADDFDAGAGALDVVDALDISARRPSHGVCCSVRGC